MWYSCVSLYTVERTEKESFKYNRCKHCVYITTGGNDSTCPDKSTVEAGGHQKGKLK